MKNSLILENSEITLYSTADDGTNRLFINNTLIPTSSWVGSGVYTYQNITIHKAESLTGNLMLKKLADFEYFFVNVALKKIYAEEVIFDPTESGIPADNVQDAIDGIFSRMFPIGALYMTATDTNPGTFLGGTWERWGSGRVPVGYDANDSDFDAAGKTGGSKSEAYTPAGENARTNITSVGTISETSITPAGTVGSKSITPSGTVGSKSLTPAGTVNNHKLTTSELPIIKFRIPHVAWYDNCAISGCSETNTAMTKEGQSQDISNTGWHNITIGSGGNHNHTFTGTAASHNHTFTGTAASHDHTFTGTAASHTHTYTGTTRNHSHTFTGTEATISHLQPYITCFIWKRTA